MKFDFNNKDRYSEYSLFLEKAFSKGFWSEGVYSGERIYWTEAKRAKKSIEQFNQTGIYIWGYDKIPMYIGKAEKQNISKRFNRYAFGSKAQYKIATNYWNHLKDGGKIKTIEELILENNLSLKYHKSRCRQAKAFGEQMTDNAWFLFMPLNVEDIHDLEHELIEKGDVYNSNMGYQSLLNRVKIGSKQKKLMKSLTVIFSHGKEGSPFGTKSKVIKACTLQRGQAFKSIDYSDCSSVEERVVKLKVAINNTKGSVVLVGSSLGGYVSTIVANEFEIDGLFLIAPALYMSDYAIQEYLPLTNHVTVRHGWKDEIIPYENSVRFSKVNKAKLELIEDNHRMSETIVDLKNSFTAFIKSVAKK
jgi:predicted esterase YcpF (UPF0227 family)